MNNLVSEIAAATREQANGLSQGNSAVGRIDLVTRQNATMVEQSTAASHHLAEEVAELTRFVGQFRIDAAVEWCDPETTPIAELMLLGAE